MEELNVESVGAIRVLGLCPQPRQNCCISVVALQLRTVSAWGFRCRLGGGAEPR
jgi:hypothetical protein